jgi:hypothetical protein
MGQEYLPQTGIERYGFRGSFRLGFVNEVARRQRIFSSAGAADNALEGALSVVRTC